MVARGHGKIAAHHASVLYCGLPPCTFQDAATFFRATSHVSTAPASRATVVVKIAAITLHAASTSTLSDIAVSRPAMSRTAPIDVVIAKPAAQPARAERERKRPGRRAGTSPNLRNPLRSSTAHHTPGDTEYSAACTRTPRGGVEWTSPTHLPRRRFPGPISEIAVYQ